MEQVVAPAAEFGTGLVVGTATNLASLMINSQLPDNLALNIAVAGGLAGVSLYLSNKYILTKLPETGSGLLFFAVAFVVSQPSLLEDLRKGSLYVEDKISKLHK